MTTTTTTSRHCEMCGATNPQVIDSYTACCNERVCDGGWPQTWVLGSDYDTRREIGTVQACCGAVADKLAAGRGVILYRAN